MINKFLSKYAGALNYRVWSLIGECHNLSNSSFLLKYKEEYIINETSRSNETKEDNKMKEWFQKMREGRDDDRIV